MRSCASSLVARGLGARRRAARLADVEERPLVGVCLDDHLHAAGGTPSPPRMPLSCRKRRNAAIGPAIKKAGTRRKCATGILTPRQHFLSRLLFARQPAGNRPRRNGSRTASCGAK
jgi:hypothetical protein